jgi:adenylate cyclase
MSGDPEQEYFADGVVEDIITALSRVKWLFVIARKSSFAYKNKSVDARQIGRELGVRYLLEGSIRKAGSRVRISGQLLEAATGAHMWADRFDGEISEIFELQDRITTHVVVAVEPSLRPAEIERAQRKPTENLDAYDLHLRALIAVACGRGEIARNGYFPSATHFGIFVLSWRSESLHSCGRSRARGDRKRQWRSLRILKR